MENTGKALVGGLGVLMALAVLSSVTQAFVPRQDYVCPIDGRRFGSYEELYAHFTTAHPTTPIDIIWE